MILVAISTASLPYLLQPVFDDVLSAKASGKVISLSLIVLGAFVLKGIASFGESVIMGFIGQRLVSDIQLRLFSHIIKLDLDFFQNHRSGEIVTRITQDVNLMRQSLSNAVMSIGKDTLTFIALLFVMIYRDPLISLISIVGFPLAIYPMIRLSKRLRSLTNKSQNEIGKLTSHLIQVFQGIRVVKSYVQEKHEENSIKQYIEDLFKFSFNSLKARSLLHPIMEILSGLAIVGVVIIGGMQVMKSGRTTGEFVSFVGALLLLYEPLKRLSHVNASIQEGISAAKRVFSWIDINPTIKNIGTKTMPKELSTNTVISFKNVSFGYIERKNAITNISFDLEVSKSIAFVGESGAGKSTIINLIPRFYDISFGKIEINGIDIKSYDLNDLRRNIALVSQDIILFDGTLLENLKYGTLNATDDDVKNAVSLAALDGFIDSLPSGYQTSIGENGTKLSGGQRQRIAIVRAMLKNAKILLLDEATSALDPISERHIQNSLKTLMKGRSTIIVAHRFSSIIGADTICVLDNGQIAAKGTHDELLSKSIPYQKLYKNQLEK